MNYTTVDIDSIALRQRPCKCPSPAGQNHLFGISFAIVIRQEFICSFDSVHIEPPSEELLDQ